MKKYIREMIADLKQKDKKNIFPPVPKSKDSGPVIHLTPEPEPVVPCDLENQELSLDPGERVRQLDFQAFQSEREQTDS